MNQPFKNLKNVIIDRLGVNYIYIHVNTTIFTCSGKKLEHNSRKYFNMLLSNCI